MFLAVKPPGGIFAACLVLPLALAGCVISTSSGPGSGSREAPTVNTNINVSQGRANPAQAARYLSAYRASRGLNAVTPNAALNAMALDQARRMAAAGRMVGHGNVISRASANGYLARHVVENIAAGRSFQSIDAVMREWQRSPAHNRNLLRPGMTHMGIGRAEAGGKVFWALVLARPRYGW